MHTTRRLSVLLLAIAPTIALAHPGHDATGLAAGLAHPLLGADHLVAALLAGAWAAQRGGALRLAIPGAFVAMLLVGLIVAPLAAFPAAPVDQAVALSVLAMGFVLAFAWRLPGAACIALAGAFALVHGIAHGSERPATGLLAYGAGLSLTTASLLAAGVLVGGLVQRRPDTSALRWLGALAATGALALFA